MKPTALLVAIPVLSVLADALPLPSGSTSIFFEDLANPKDIFIVSPLGKRLKSEWVAVSAHEKKKTAQAIARKRNGLTPVPKDEAVPEACRSEDLEGKLAKRYEPFTFNYDQVVVPDDAPTDTAVADPTASDAAQPRQQMSRWKKNLAIPVAIVAIALMAFGATWYERHPSDSWRGDESWGYK